MYTAPEAPVVSRCFDAVVFLTLNIVGQVLIMIASMVSGKKTLMGLYFILVLYNIDRFLKNKRGSFVYEIALILASFYLFLNSKKYSKWNIRAFNYPVFNTLE